jgi:hypothetical protein
MTRSTQAIKEGIDEAKEISEGKQNPSTEHKLDNEDHSVEAQKKKEDAKDGKGKKDEADASADEEARNRDAKAASIKKH